MVGQAALRYEEQQQNTYPSHLQLVVMCYDAAVKDLKDAKSLHQAQRMDAAYDKIRHTQDIITELLVGLDYERGGSLAQNLSRIYNFILRQLIGIQSSQDTKIYDQLARILEELKSAWQQLSLN
jgi:flagellar protein FliS